MNIMLTSSWRKYVAALVAGTFLTSGSLTPSFARDRDDFRTTTPIKHLVIIFQENASFDHYFATYPNAKNSDGTPFFAREDTPTVNGLTDGNAQFPERVNVGLHDFNPNLARTTPSGDPNTNPNSPAFNANPFRMTHAQAITCSNNHGYTAEQQATDGGLMDQFPQHAAGLGNGCLTDGTTVMGYFDGNTVTAMWNYAQRFSMSDNSWGSVYGPSTPGALNLISGQTGGAVLHVFSGTLNLHTGLVTEGAPLNTSVTGAFFVGPTNPQVTTDVNGANATVPSGTLITDIDPYLDDCGSDKGGTKAGATTIELTGKNVGDLLNAKGVTWGWFAGGFRPLQKPATAPGSSDGPFDTPNFGGTVPAPATGIGTANFTPAVCGAAHLGHPDSTGEVFNPPNPNNVNGPVSDYSAHHSPFQYYASTRNPHHLPPASVAEIGHNGQANHQYDLVDFFTALRAGNLPAVSFIKAQAWADGHPGNSDPLSEQRFLAQTINALQQSPEWAETAVFIAWDDSDGWYDHAMPPVVNPSAAPGFDAINNGTCGTPKPDALQGRCGLGPRLVLNMVSPWSKVNYIDHSLTDQSSLLRFVEDNWDLDYIDGPATHDPNNGLRKPGFAVNPQTQSFDVITGSFFNMFDFDDQPDLHRFILNPVTGAVIEDSRDHDRDRDHHDHDRDHDHP